VTSEELRRRWPDKTAEKLFSGILAGDFFEISSSELKNRMEKFTEAGDIIHLKDCLDPAVCDYIVGHGLYVSERRGNE